MVTIVKSIMAGSMECPELSESVIPNDEFAKSCSHKLQPMNRFRDMSKLRNYEIIQKLGQGTFGVVQKARNIKTKELVALKQLINHSAKEGFPITAMREITILKKLNHKNILKIIDMIYEEPKISNPQDILHQRGCFYTVSPYMCSDLVGLLENPNINLEVSHIKCFMIQLLQGIQYIHEQMFLHRDIKAANILIDRSGTLKIADFGLARVYHGSPPKLMNGPGGGERAYTGLVVTRWYRPPELLLGERRYTTAVDMWGIGCVFGELFTRKPILVGKTDSHQAQLIFDLIGPPNSINWTQARNLPNKHDLNIGLTCQRSLESKFAPLMSPDGIDLLSGLLTLDPYKRFNALDALNHNYFKTDPLPILPQGLPKFEECHEIDKERFKLLREKKNNTNEANRISKTQFPKGPAEYNNSNNYSRNRNSNFPSALPKQPKFYNQHQQESHAPHRNHTDTYIPKDSKEGPVTNAPLKESNKPITSYQSLRDRSPRREAHTSRGPPTKNLNNISSSSSASNADSGAPNAVSQNNYTNVKAPAGIFMTNPRKQRPKPNTQPSLRNVSAQFKKRKLISDEQNESDLTDFDEDVKDNKQLDSFLDWDAFTRSPENRKLQHEKKQFEAKHK